MYVCDKYCAEQCIRSSGSASLNFREFAWAGTQKDTFNKLRVSLKEINECNNNLKLLLKANLGDEESLIKLQDEA